METMTYVAIAIFITAYALIISEKIHRTVVGLFGAIPMILLEIKRDGDKITLNVVDKKLF